MNKRTHQLDLALLQESSPTPYDPKINLLGQLYDERTKLSNTFDSCSFTRKSLSTLSKLGWLKTDILSVNKVIRLKPYWINYFYSSAKLKVPVVSPLRLVVFLVKWDCYNSHYQVLLFYSNHPKFLMEFCKGTGDGMSYNYSPLNGFVS